MRRWRLAAGVVAAALAGAAVAGAVLVFLDDGSSPAGGDLIAHGCEEPGNRWYAICLVRTDGTGRRQLTQGIEASDPDWSPDGRRIVFTRHRSGGQRVGFEYDELFVVDADGKGLRKLTDNRTGFTLGKPVWSPDGRRIAFLRGRTLPSAGVTFGAVFVMNEDGTGLRRITDGPLDSSPAWSPDGTEIAFTRAAGYGSFANADVYVVSTVDGRERRLTGSIYRLETEPAWSPDGTRIAFAATTPETPFTGRAALHVMGRDGSDRRLVTAHRLFSRYPGNLAWSPDGERIALEGSTAAGCTTIALVRVGDVVHVLNPLVPCDGEAYVALAPAWQPESG